MWRRLMPWLVALSATITSAGQVERPGEYAGDVPYDGRVTFVRLQWRGGSRYGGGWTSAWNHDYPRAEQHLSQILRELTHLDIHADCSRILSLDDPELFKYPIAFMWEPGFWTMNESEATAF